jgi:hypothetical protein
MRKSNGKSKAVKEWIIILWNVSKEVDEKVDDGQPKQEGSREGYGQ